MLPFCVPSVFVLTLPLFLPLCSGRKDSLCVLSIILEYYGAGMAVRVPRQLCMLIVFCSLCTSGEPSLCHILSSLLCTHFRRVFVCVMHSFMTYFPHCRSRRPLPSSMVLLLQRLAILTPQMRMLSLGSLLWQAPLPLAPAKHSQLVLSILLQLIGHQRVPRTP